MRYSIIVCILLVIGVADAGEKKVNAWADILLRIENYTYKSNDIEVLDLTPQSTKFNDIRGYLQSVFQQHALKGRTVLGIYDRYSEMYSNSVKQKTAWNDPDFVDNYVRTQREASAQIAADIRGRYGNNIGVFLCRIKIKRTQFPILYEIEFRYTSEDDLGLRTGIRGMEILSNNLGFGTPETIDGEIKLAIKEQIEGLMKYNLLGYHFYGEEPTRE